MKWLDRHVGALQGALQEGPEVFESVCPRCKHHWSEHGGYDGICEDDSSMAICGCREVAPNAAVSPEAREAQERGSDSTRADGETRELERLRSSLRDLREGLEQKIAMFKEY